ncbi:MAG: hypothetical protein ABI823_18885 [Bryobacteraceae bacterium]
MTLRILLPLLVAIVASAEINPKITIHTYVREDIFAGWMANDMDRFAQGEKKLDEVLQSRPAERGSVLAWQGGSALFRAVTALKANRMDEFESQYAKTLKLFAEAETFGMKDPGVFAAMGGSYGLFADRLPEQYRAAAWAKAYQCYSILAKAQMPAVEQLPLHLKGEMLGGMAQSAQRTGHEEEMTAFLDKMTTLLAGTPYASRAAKWKENPAVAAKTSLVCQSCHDGGRLEPTLARLQKAAESK